ncbi:GNAT family N-acetyltransferase [Mesorhizobium sp. CN2-181]|uniref:GNAT family N-acetyltransferase n=1 Tax=Mesorhizobium yinganensis TaxID=3157707 RepID=UPI0032B824A8
MQTVVPSAEVPIEAKVGLIPGVEPGLGIAHKTLGRIGSLEARLARNDSEIAAAQEVRYRVFYEELGAKSNRLEALDRRDADRFDACCDHILVFDHALPGPEHNRIIGTYRLLNQEGAALAGGFYSEDEFDLGSLIQRHPGKRFLELGRSCVLPQYRSKRTIETLWQGIWAYVLHHDIDVMAGCASFHGTVPAAHAEALSFLTHNFRAEPGYDVSALPGRCHPMDLVPCEAINAKSAFLRMPPLIKGYLRLGARIGDGCVVDHDFETVDVFMILPVKEIKQRYISYYSGDAGRLAA